MRLLGTPATKSLAAATRAAAVKLGTIMAMSRSTPIRPSGLGSGVVGARGDIRRTSGCGRIVSGRLTRLRSPARTSRTVGRLSPGVSICSKMVVKSCPSTPLRRRRLTISLTISPSRTRALSRRRNAGVGSCASRYAIGTIPARARHRCAQPLRSSRCETRDRVGSDSR